MELLAGTLGIIGLLILAATALGVVVPSVFKNRATGVVPTRGRLFFRGVGTVLAVFVLTAVLMPASESPPDAKPSATEDAGQPKVQAPEDPKDTTIAEQREDLIPEEEAPDEAAPQQPAAAQQQAKADPEEKSRHCTSFALTYASAVKARHDGDPFDGLYKSAHDMAKFVVNDGDAAKLARVEARLREVTREVQTRPGVDENVIRAMSTSGFTATMNRIAADCMRPGT